MGRHGHLLIGIVVAVCLLAPASAHAVTAPFAGESIAAGDQSQQDRLNQTGPSSCGKPGVAPPQVHGMGGTRQLDTFGFRNISPVPVCVTVTLDTACSGGKTLMSTAYTGNV